MPGCPAIRRCTIWTLINLIGTDPISREWRTLSFERMMLSGFRDMYSMRNSLSEQRPKSTGHKTTGRVFGEGPEGFQQYKNAHEWRSALYLKLSPSSASDSRSIVLLFSVAFPLFLVSEMGDLYFVPRDFGVLKGPYQVSDESAHVRCILHISFPVSSTRY